MSPVKLSGGRRTRPASFSLPDTVDGAAPVVPMYPGGEGDSVRVVPRRAVLNVWRRLGDLMAGDEHFKTLFLQGPPGMGKTLSVWTWCVRYAAQGHKVVFVRTLSAGPWQWAVLEGDALDAGSLEREDVTGTRAVLNGIYKECTDVQLFVVDGVTSDTYKEVLQWIPESCKCKAVVVSSSQVIVAGDQAYTGGLVKAAFPVWTVDDFSLLPGVDVDSAAFQEQHFYAGVSVRYMKWAMSDVDRVKNELDEYIAAVGSFKTLLEGGGGNKAPQAVNHLQVSNQLVSRYVLDKLLSKAAGTAYVMAYEHFGANRAMLGWIYEHQALSQIRAGGVSSLGAALGPQVAFGDPHVVVGTPGDLAGPSSTAGLIWFIPDGRNFPNVDACAVRVHADRTADVFGVQTTVAVSHKLSWQAYLHSTTGPVAWCANEGLEVVRLVHVGVSPRRDGIRWELSGGVPAAIKGLEPTHVCVLWAPVEAGGALDGI